MVGGCHVVKPLILFSDIVYLINLPFKLSNCEQIATWSFGICDKVLIKLSSISVYVIPQPDMRLIKPDTHYAFDIYALIMYSFCAHYVFIVHWFCVH